MLDSHTLSIAEYNNISDIFNNTLVGVFSAKVLLFKIFYAYLACK